MPLTIVLEYQITDHQEESPGLGSLSHLPHSLDVFKVYDDLTLEKATNGATPTEVKAEAKPSPIVSATTSKASHKRRISAATPRDEREAEEIEERSASGRLLRPTRKASSTKSTRKCKPSLTSTIPIQ